MQLKKFIKVSIGLVAVCVLCFQEINADGSLKGKDRSEVGLQTLIESGPNKLVYLSVVILTEGHRAESKFELARNGESYKVFVNLNEIWTWNLKSGYRLYRLDESRTLVVFDPKDKGINIPNEVRFVTSASGSVPNNRH